MKIFSKTEHGTEIELLTFYHLGHRTYVDVKAFTRQGEFVTLLDTRWIIRPPNRTTEEAEFFDKFNWFLAIRREEPKVEKAPITGRVMNLIAAMGGVPSESSRVSSLMAMMKGATKCE
jgi:hypothetical protein